MSTKESGNNAMKLPDAPAVRGLGFRGFRGEMDFPAMLAVIEGSKEADGSERTDTLEGIARNYQNLTNSDPYRDMLFAEVDGDVVGYSRVWWWSGKDNKRVYSHFAFLRPEWRHKGIRHAMLSYNERRLREIASEGAASRPANGARLFESWASETEAHWASLLEEHGYKAARYGFEMARPDLEKIPDLPLPEGLEVRPVQPEHERVIWAAAREAFVDMWDYAEEDWTDEELDAWRQEPTFDSGLWQVAWDGDQVAGMVLNFVNREENEEYNRQRGYTEGICVRRPWRRRGLAKALIARSFRMHRDLGMTEAALGVDAQNPNGALQLYKSMGFRPVKRHTTYRKPLG